MGKWMHCGRGVGIRTVTAIPCAQLLEPRRLLSGTAATAAWQGFTDRSAQLQSAGYTFAVGGDGGNENYYDGDFADWDFDGLIDRALVNRYGVVWNTGGGGVMIPASNQANNASPSNSQKNLTGFIHNLANGAGDDATQWADVDNDGDPDALTGGNGETFLVQQNRKGRFFLKSRDLNSGAYVSAWQIVSTDLEGDGDVDVSVSSGFPYDYSLLVNDGAGNFTDQAASRGLALANDPPQGTVSGDVDGDGDYDLVMLKGSERVTPGFGLVTARNNGGGQFSRTLYPFARTFPRLPDVRVNSDSNQSMSLGDIDDDGDLDVVVALGLFFTDHNLLNQTIGSHPVVSHAVFVNDGTGRFTEQSAQRWDVTGYSGPILRGDNGDLVDLDHDGDLDFAALRRDSAEDIKQVDFFLNDGTGRFRYDATKTVTYPGGGVGFGNDLDVTDLDGDGVYDLWVGLAGERVRTLINTYDDPAGVPADVPRNLQVASRGPGGVTLSWQAPPFASLARSYRVYRSTAPGLATQERELVKTVGERHQDEGFAAPITRHTTTAYLGDPDVTLDGANNAVRFTDRTAQPGVAYYYSVVHVGVENTHSQPTPEVAATPPPASGADTTPPHLVITKPAADEWSQFPEIVLHYGDGGSGIDPSSLRVSLNRPIGTGNPATGGRPAGADISDLFFYKDGRVFVSPFEDNMALPLGSGTLTASIADLAGNRRTMQKSFRVDVAADRLPVADVAVTPTADARTFQFSGAGSSDPDGEVMRWEWYFPDGTTAVGKDVTWRAPADGTYEVELYVWDDRGGVAEAEVDVVAGGPGGPVIASLSDSPDPVTSGGAVTLTAGGVAAPAGAGISEVRFYRESNGTPGLQAGSDTPLGTDPTSPYTLSVPTAGLAAGAYTYYALATAANGALSNVASTTNTVSGTPPTPGSIAGRKWDDADADGVMDGDEHGIYDWQVFVDTNGDGDLDPGEPNTRTNTSGMYSFTNLAPGTYRVREVLRDGWRQTAPATGVYVVTVASGQSVTGMNFGNTRRPYATVAGRRAFYNHSLFDGNLSAPNAQDDGAVATDKQALLPGQRATFANYTSYSRGLNGVMIDLANLPGGELVADDFEFRRGNGSDLAAWTAGPPPTSVTVRRGAGTGGTDRVTLVWPDYNPAAANPLAQAVARGWLQVTVKANPDTGLAAADVFYFGNAIGETGNLAAGATAAVVNSADVVRTRNNQLRPAGITSAFDFNRSGGRVNSVDLVIARNNQVFALQLIIPQVGAIASVAPASVRTVVPADRHQLPPHTPGAPVQRAKAKLRSGVLAEAGAEALHNRPVGPWA